MAHTSIATHCPPPPPTDAVLDLVVLEGGVDVVPPMLALGDTLYGRWGCLRGNVPTAVTGHCSAELHFWWGGGGGRRAPPPPPPPPPPCHAADTPTQRQQQQQQ
jgi:hypothetical protein